MTLIDSEKAFQKRCYELNDGLFEKLKGQHINSFSTLAFSLGSPEAEIHDSLQPVGGGRARAPSESSNEGSVNQHDSGQRFVCDPID